MKENNQDKETEKMFEDMLEEILEKEEVISLPEHLEEK